MRVVVVVTDLTFLIALLIEGCGGATSLSPLDVRAEQNQQRAATAIVMRAQGMDAGAIESLAESIYCGAGGTLKRAGSPAIDAAIPCP